MAGKEAELIALIKPVVVALGCDLWGVEYRTQGKQTLVRIYIDSADGVDVDVCARVSRQISSVFDVEDPILGEYTLEVSSPGMDRPLFTLEQFGSHIGERVKIRLRLPFEGRRNYSGQLTAIEGDEIVIAVDEHEYVLPYELIDKANIVPSFE